MTERSSDARGDYVDQRGVLITAAGRERTRVRLAELDGKWTPEQREQHRFAVPAACPVTVRLED